MRVFLFVDVLPGGRPLFGMAPHLALSVDSHNAYSQTVTAQRTAYYSEFGSDTTVTDCKQRKVDFFCVEQLF